MEKYDVIVLGLGAAGSATLYQLARRGLRVLGLDQFAPPHTLGSTHGDTRITRLAIGEGAHYTPLAVRSHEIWRELEEETGAKLLTTNGGLFISTVSNRYSFHGGAFFATTVAAARKHKIDHELLDGKQIRRRFPQFQVDDHEVGYFEKSAGFVRPEACIRAQLGLAEFRGADVRSNEKVLSFRETADQVSVTTSAATYAADKLVIAAGPWLPELLAQKHARHFKVFRQVLYWFDVEAQYDAFRPEKFPIFIWELPDGHGGIYGFPAIDGPKGGFKIATEHYEATTTPHEVERKVSADEIAHMFRENVGPFFPGAGARCIRSAACLYTVTNDFGFVVDHHPDFRRVIVASPCSGHGFKHSAALGEAIADLTQGASSPFDLGAFGFARLER
jgi:sarcosine oxidase